MPACLRQHPLARIDQHHRKIRGGGAGDHVAGVLLVSRGVGDDELALLGGEKTVCHIDGDALLALRGKPIHQQREIDVLALRADPLGIRLERGELVLEDHFGVVQQPPISVDFPSSTDPQVMKRSRLLC